MSIPAQVLDYALHIDRHLAVLLVQYGPWFWGILFLLLFAETGLVVTPFLPGDSVLFASGVLVARGGGLGIWWAFAILAGAAILGDTVNYWIGHALGPRLLRNENSKILKRDYLDRTRVFFARYGGKTVVIARFIPFVRTFAPFLAGVGDMEYVRFLAYNAVGAVTWVGLFLFGGYLFGGIPFVRKNFVLAILVVIVITTIPIVVEYVRQRRISHRAAADSQASRS
jgi:membrane-associated protein